MTSRLAIVGTGVISEAHAAAIRSLEPDAELVAVVSRSPQRGADWAARHGVRAFTDIRTAVAESAVDIVVVCSESGRHADHAIAALEAGAHVFVEKPADISMERIDDIAAAQRSTGATVAVVSQHRFDCATERAAEAVREGRLGNVTSAIASLALWRDQAYYDSAAWRGTRRLDGGGALMNQGVHVVDVLLSLMGPAEEVVGFAAALAHTGIDVEDVAVGAVRFSSGALAVIHASTAAYPGGDVRLQVHGDLGSLVIRNDRLEWLGTEAVDEDPRAEDPLRRQYQDLFAALRHDQPVRVGLADSRAAVGVITGLYESARTGRAVTIR